MKSFEPVYKELEVLFIHKLPEYVEKINKEHNDGIILKTFENQTLEEECIKLPCFKFTIEESEYSEKDRIIDNSLFSMNFEIKMSEYGKNKIFRFWRYFEAIKKMLKEETGNFGNVIISKVEKSIIRITIVV